MEKNKLIKEKELVEKIKENMLYEGYTQVKREDYHKNKRKFEHGVWRIGRSYYYFINFKELTSKELLRKLKSDSISPPKPKGMGILAIFI